MHCIIVDDEPLAREGVEMLITGNPHLTLTGSFNNTSSAAGFLATHPVDLIFLDIEMPGMNGIDFARSVSAKTLVIFTTAYAEYALNSYEVDAIDYLVKPIYLERFQKAVNKAALYHNLLNSQQPQSSVEAVADDYIFVKADHKMFKVSFAELLFIEGLKDYVVLHLQNKKIITAMNIKTIHEQLPRHLFVRISKSYIINTQQITALDNNSVYIQQHDIPIGNVYREHFLNEFVRRKLLSR